MLSRRAVLSQKKSFINEEKLFSDAAEDIHRNADHGAIVQIIKTTSKLEAQRARRAQYAGCTTTLQIAGQTMTGRVHSVIDDELNIRPKWTVKLILQLSVRAKSASRQDA